MTKKAECRRLRHDLLEIVKGLIGRELTDEETTSLNTIMEIFAKESRTDLEKNQQKSLKEDYELIEALRKEIIRLNK